MALLTTLVMVMIWIVLVAVVFGVGIWALKKLWPEAPAILTNGLIVLGVLIALLLILQAFGGVDLGLPGGFRAR